VSAVLDTHSAIWYLRPSKELSPTALQAIRRAKHHIADRGQATKGGRRRLFEPKELRILNKLISLMMSKDVCCPKAKEKNSCATFSAEPRKTIGQI
jgi:hypothetical protein